MKKNIWIMLVLVIFTSVLLAACGGSDKILLSSASSSVKAGESVQLTSDTTGVTFSLVDSDELATIDSESGLITAKTTATVGAEIQAVAKKGSVTSNTVKITIIGDDISEKIVLTAAAPSVRIGETIELESDTEGVTFVLIDSADNATINASTGLITVKETATAGAIIKAQAKKDDIESNIVQILIVGDEVEEKILLTASSPSVRAGGTVKLEADTEGVTFVILGDESVAEINQASGVMTVNDDVEAGTIISVVAGKDGITSNFIHIVVISLDRIVLVVDSPIVFAGGSAELSSDVKGVEFFLLDVSADSEQVTSTETASIDASGLITVEDDASVLDEIIAVATRDGIVSNSIKIIVGKETADIELTVDNNTVTPNGTAQLSTDISEATYMLIGDETHATIDASTGVLTVNSDAVVGQKIHVVAYKGTEISNYITITVGEILATAITNVSVADENLLAGHNDIQTTTLSCTLEPVNSTQSVMWIIINSYSDASLVGNVLTLQADAAVGQILIIAKVGSIISSSIVVNVSIPLTDIELSFDEETVRHSEDGEIEMWHGDEVQLTATLTPTNTTETDISYEIDGNYQFASISDSGLITLLSGAEQDESFDVIATRGDVVSNKITVLVKEVELFLINMTPDIEDIDGKDTLMVVNTDSSSASSKALEFSVNDDKGNLVREGYRIEYALETNNGIISISTLSISTNVCLIQQLKHGDATIIATLYNSATSGAGKVVNTNSVVIKSIKTPNQIELPEFLEESENLKGLENYSVGKDQAFDYVTRIPNIDTASHYNYGASTAVSYTFELLNGNEVAETGDAVGKFEEGTITFNKTGKVRVTATTDSGNPDETKEKSVSHTFDVNEYKNVSTYEDFKFSLQNASAELGDTRAVNVVITSRPAEGYGFSLVPFFMLSLNSSGSPFNATNLEKLNSLYNYGGSDSNFKYIEHVGIMILGKNVIINGNNHALDFSKMPLINFPENRSVIRIDGNDHQNGNDGFDGATKKLFYISKLVGLHEGATIGFDGTNVSLQSGYDTAPVYKVDITSLKFFGNLGVTGLNLTDKKMLKGEKDKATARKGTHSQAIEIGRDITRANFDINIDNIEIINFHTGIKIDRAVNEYLEPSETTPVNKSRISNAKLDQIYATGVTITKSQIELNNFTFGQMGAGPFEASSSFSTMAGINENKNQIIRFTGKTDFGDPIKNANKGDTQYYQDYSMGGADFHQLMNAGITDMDKNVVEHLNFHYNTFMFSAFSFNDPTFGFGLIDALDYNMNVDTKRPYVIDKGFYTTLAGYLGDTEKANEYIVGVILAPYLGGVFYGNNGGTEFKSLPLIGKNLTTVEYAGEPIVNVNDLPLTGENTTARLLHLEMYVSAFLLDSKYPPELMVPMGSIFMLNSKYVSQ